MRFVPRAPDIHVIFGWLKVDVIKPVEEFSAAERRWADYHPHFSPDRTPEEVICLARNEMSLPKVKRPLPGFGVFPEVRVDSLSDRSLFHAKSMAAAEVVPADQGQERPYRATPTCGVGIRTRDWAYLDTVPIGQEFVLDCREYPEAFEWLREVFGCNT